jgi:hypothetical protein
VHAQGEVPGGDHQEEARGDRVRLAVIEKQNCLEKLNFELFYGLMIIHGPVL